MTIEQAAITVISAKGSATVEDVFRKVNTPSSPKRYTMAEVNGQLLNWVEDNPEYGMRSEDGYIRFFKYTRTEPRATYTLPGGLTLSGTPDQIIEAASHYGIGLHYSQTGRKFEPIEQMATNHLFNVVMQGLEGCKNASDLVSYLVDSPYIRQLFINEGEIEVND